MWNEKTKQLVADGKLVVIGVVQEQHAERARLYKQWKQYDFPIAQDAFTGLGLAVVPVPILIDEYGYVISSRLRPSGLEKLLAQKSDVPASPAPVLDPEHVAVKWLKANAVGKPTIDMSLAIGDALLKTGTPESVRESIQWYRSCGTAIIGQDKMDLMGLVQFRMGVAFRMLFDSTVGNEKDPHDFSSAAMAWSKALEHDPNQYIWRRRIQQYGPRQMKPYPFYDWVDQAVEEISARGESPVELTVPLSGAEIAQPNRKFETVTAVEKNPDSDGRIDRDDDGLVSYHATVVPQKVVPGKTVRVHLRFVPDNGHWNNEAPEMMVWINDSANGTSSNSRLVHANAKKPSSDEPRSLEFEFKISSEVTGEFELNGYALYYVCTSDGGQCFFLRQDISIPIRIESRK